MTQPSTITSLIATVTEIVSRERPGWSKPRCKAFAARAVARGPNERAALGLGVLCEAVYGRCPDEDESYLWAACGDEPVTQPEDRPLLRACREARDRALAVLGE